jgi:hypothetical protein
MKIYFLALTLLMCSLAHGDSWAPQTPQTISSPRGEFLLRAIPPQRLDDEGKEWSKTMFIVYQLTAHDQDYRESSRFYVEGRPLELFINDKGDRIVTIDQYFGIGVGPRVVAVYNTRGRELKRWALKDFFDKRKIARLPQTTASTHWRGQAGWMYDQSGIWISKPTIFEDRADAFDEYILDLRRLRISKRKN